MSCLAEELLASEDGICFMEFGWLVDCLAYLVRSSNWKKYAVCVECGSKKSMTVVQNLLSFEFCSNSNKPL
jgi:hypothetical protein